MDIYLIYILVWIGLLIFLAILFKILPAKMKEAKDPQTKSSLFTILMMFAIPLILVVVVGPIVLIAGDENMPVDYKYTFGVIAFLVIVYLLSIQRSRKK